MYSWVPSAGGGRKERKHIKKILLCNKTSVAYVKLHLLPMHGVSSVTWVALLILAGFADTSWSQLTIG